MSIRSFLALAGATVLLAAPLRGQAAPSQPDWASMNKAFEGASFVNNDRTCLECHTDAAAKYAGTPHARVADTGRPGASGCESCHGPRSKHLEDPQPATAWAKLSAEDQSGVCLQCHEGAARMEWQQGPHADAQVSCSDCHVVMEGRSTRSLLASSRESETCYTCHKDTKGQMSKPSHHPVREGRMECSSCHNVHGAGPSLVTGSTVNETCESCHTEKRGPYVWEHAPVRENCASCHTPHGSSNRMLLAKKDSFLCLQCHSYGGHINLPRYNRTSNPYGSGCMNCHMAVHGSNHPSGAKLTR